MSGELTEHETGALHGLEEAIDRGLQTFVEVGQALSEIRERRLYRGTHATFERYCRERWGFLSSRARQLIAAAETVTAVTAGGLSAPTSEAVARELVPLRNRPDELRAAWEDSQVIAAAAGKAPTAELVRQNVTEVKSRRTPGRAGETTRGVSSPRAYPVYVKACKAWRAVGNGREQLAGELLLEDALAVLGELERIASDVGKVIAEIERRCAAETDGEVRTRPTVTLDASDDGIDALIDALKAAGPEIECRVVDAILDCFAPEQWHEWLEERLDQEESDA